MDQQCLANRDERLVSWSVSCSCQPARKMAGSRQPQLSQGGDTGAAILRRSHSPHAECQSPPLTPAILSYIHPIHPPTTRPTCPGPRFEPLCLQTHRTYHRPHEPPAPSHQSEPHPPTPAQPAPPLPSSLLT